MSRTNFVFAMLCADDIDVPARKQLVRETLGCSVARGDAVMDNA